MGGTTPVSPVGTGGVTPGRGLGGPNGGGGRGGVTPRGGKKGKFSREQEFWLGVITLPWVGTFLPKGGEAGYAATELTLDEAVKGLGGAHAWKLQKRPTIVLAYDPSQPAHMKIVGAVEKNADLKVAARYFNLLRIDVRMVTGKKSLPDPTKDVTFYVYRANGTRVASVKSPTDVTALLKAIEPVFISDYENPASNAIAAMGAILARRTFVADEITRHELVVICPDCGKRNITVADRLAELRKEDQDLTARMDQLVKVRSGALVASAN